MKTIHHNVILYIRKEEKKEIENEVAWRLNVSMKWLSVININTAANALEENVYWLYKWKK